MDKVRKIKKIVNGKNAIDGAGVKLVRLFGNGETEDFDPFLLMDGFDSTDPDDYIKGFPWHPHRGIETVTYLVSGEIDHGDSLGNKGKILDGDCQWMTAGSGIIHQEMPQPSELIRGVQLWVNLPAKHKMVNPKYRDIKNNMIPIVNEEHSKIKIISGEYKGQRGAINGDYVDVTYLDVDLEPNAQWTMETDPNSNLFIYTLTGSCIVKSNEGDIEIGAKNVVLFTKEEKFWIKGLNNGVRFLIISGKPLKESISWGGPIVMNTKEELNRAFAELNKGTFIK
jgi:redox-sensitive bicupin YhaK (pirin superfamily)